MPEFKQTPTLHFSKFCVEGQQYIQFTATMPIGHTLEDALNPEYWVHVCHILQAPTNSNEPDRSGSIIELRTEDHSMYTRLYVRAVLERGLTVEVIKDGVTYFGPKEMADEKFDTRWNVGKRGWDIIRQSDKEIVGDGSEFKTKEMANEWIEKTVRM